jgi:hypothetical protein
VFASPKRSIIGFATDKEITALIPLQLVASPGTKKQTIYPRVGILPYTSNEDMY